MKKKRICLQNPKFFKNIIFPKIQLKKSIFLNNTDFFKNPKLVKNSFFLNTKFYQKYNLKKVIKILMPG